jgi:hypothetical protein
MKPEKVGSEMAKLIPEWAIKSREGCECSDWTFKMDKWGVEGCERHRRSILSHLVLQSDKLIPLLAAMPQGLRVAGAKSLLNMAIRNAKKVAEQEK